MSDETPRTDAAADHVANLALAWDCRTRHKHRNAEEEAVPISVARQLERELTAALAEIARLKRGTGCADLEAVTKERDAINGKLIVADSLLAQFKRELRELTAMTKERDEAQKCLREAMEMLKGI